MKILAFRVRLKTGFYETKPYDLLISKQKLVLSPIESKDDAITLSETEILFVYLREIKHYEIEVQTSDHIFQGIFYYNIDIEEVLRLLRNNLHTQIIFET